MTSNSNASNGWTPELVREYAAGAARLEMWTIPLYLCAAYSIKNVAVDKNGLPTFAPVHNPYEQGSKNFYLWFGSNPEEYAAQFAFNTILSVAIQEMLHCELASNICNALGGTVDFVGQNGSLAPVYDADHVPYVAVPNDLRNLVKLGPLNEDSIALMQWVEHPLPQNIDPPLCTGPQPNYRSIGEFYYALRHGIDSQWSNLYPPIPNTPAPTAEQLKQKDNFQQRLNMLMNKYNLLLRQDYKFSIMIWGDTPTAEPLTDSAIEAIVEQGEGSDADSHKHVNPHFQPTTADSPIEVSLDKWTHWERFEQIGKVMAARPIETYDTQNPSPILELVQEVMYYSFSAFIDLLTAGFNSDQPLNLASMAGVGSRINEVWQNGGVPDIHYQEYVPSQYPHACQGLNSCQGQGRDGTGTGAGDGDCATAYFHTCASGNKCKSQSGCGYAAFPDDPNDFTKNWLPSQNADAAQNGQGGGGCGAPIPPGQLFNSTENNPPTVPLAPETFPDGSQCRGASVWDRARKELEIVWQQEGKTIKPAPPVNALRNSLKPTAS